MVTLTREIDFLFMGAIFCSSLRKFRFLNDVLHVTKGLPQINSLDVVFEDLFIFYESKKKLQQLKGGIAVLKRGGDVAVAARGLVVVNIFRIIIDSTPINTAQPLSRIEWR